MRLQTVGHCPVQLPVVHQLGKCNDHNMMPCTKITEAQSRYQAQERHMHPPAPPNMKALPSVNTSSAVARLGLREAAMRSRKPAAVTAAAGGSGSGSGSSSRVGFQVSKQKHSSSTSAAHYACAQRQCSCRDQSSKRQMHAAACCGI